MFLLTRRSGNSKMAANRDKPDRWKPDVCASVDLYNDWFMQFAPRAFRETRHATTGLVEEALGFTRNLVDVDTSRVAKSSVDLAHFTNVHMPSNRARSANRSGLSVAIPR